MVLAVMAVTSGITNERFFSDNFDGDSRSVDVDGSGDTNNGGGGGAAAPNGGHWTGARWWYWNQGGINAQTGSLPRQPAAKEVPVSFP